MKKKKYKIFLLLENEEYSIDTANNFKEIFISLEKTIDLYYGKRTFIIQEEKDSFIHQKIFISNNDINIIANKQVDFLYNKLKDKIFKD